MVAAKGTFNQGVLLALAAGSLAWGSKSVLLGHPLAGSIEILAGLGLGGVAAWLGLRPADQLWLRPESWTLSRPDSGRLVLQAAFVAQNLNPELEVTLAQVEPRPHLLSKGSTEALSTQVRVRSRHADAPPRADNYWPAYIISPQSQTHLEVEVELRGEGLDPLQSLWLELDYIQYGRGVRTPKTAHLIVPLQAVEPLAAPRWQEREGVQVSPVPTHLLTPSDDLAAVIERYVKPLAQPGDYVAISETAAAIVQGHFRHPTAIKLGWLAPRLCYFFPSKTSLSSAYGLQTLIDSSGSWRVLGAFVLGAAAKLVRIPGLFYRLAGEQATLIDDVTGTLPPYDQFIVLGPQQPQALVDRLRAETGCEVAIVDANDLGQVRILAATAGVDPERVKVGLRRNPAGNSDEQTPIVLIRPN